MVVVRSSRVASDADADADVVPMMVVEKQIRRRLALALVKKALLVWAALEGAARGERRGIGKSGHVGTSLGGGHAILYCTRRSLQTMRWWGCLPRSARAQCADFEINERYCWRSRLLRCLMISCAETVLRPLASFVQQQSSSGVVKVSSAEMKGLHRSWYGLHPLMPLSEISSMLQAQVFESVARKLTLGNACEVPQVEVGYGLGLRESLRRDGCASAEQSSGNASSDVVRTGRLSARDVRLSC